MPKTSAGILLYRRVDGRIEVFLVHPGGPFWVRRDAGVWSIPKGEFLPGEVSLDAARREFIEETGIAVSGDFLELQPIRQPGGKVVYAWAVEGDCDASNIRSNTFSIEWPRSSGRSSTYPEVDRAEWFSMEEAREKILKGQLPLLDQLLEVLG